MGLGRLKFRNFARKKPIYALNELNGPSHDREFDISVIVNGKELGRATGSSKKIAEQSAAKIALDKINQAAAEMIEMGLVRIVDQDLSPLVLVLAEGDLLFFDQFPEAFDVAITAISQRANNFRKSRGAYR